MEDGRHHHHQHEEAPNNGGSSSNSTGSERNNNNNNNSEPVRSRWTPKPEQILILESIFNSGMVNPPKDETVRIRKLLENFGSVGDANVFYWFQNRRSRSRRRQRQGQATANLATAMSQHDQQQQHPSAAAGGLQFNIINNNNNYNSNVFTSGHDSPFYSGGYNGGGGGSSSSSGNMGDDHMSCLYSSSYSGGQICGPGIEQNSGLSSSVNVTPDPAASSHLHFQSPPGVGGGGYITVFINGVATEVARGPLDMKAMFGQQHQDLVLLHSSGLPVNDLTFPLQHGESYFLVSRPT